jgi:cell division protein FtsA
MNDMSRPPRTPHAALTPPDEPPTPRRAGRAGPFGVLDIGTTKIICLIGRTESDGTLRVLGYGWHRSQGLRNGSITDVAEAEKAIRAAVGQAEDMADLRLRAVTVNLSCGEPESRLYHVQWPIGGRQVTESDIRRVVAEGRDRAVVEHRDQIHALTLDFTVDETAGVADPRGLFCETLAVRLHVMDAAAAALRNLDATIGRCDLDIAGLVAAPLAAGFATLVEDERMLGTILVDMGGGTTSLAAFHEGSVVHTAQIRVGGLHVTNDIARILSTPITHAERLKTLYGTVQSSPDDERELLPVPLVGEAEHQIAKVPRSMVVSIIRPRLEETFEMVRDKIENAGLGHAASGRVVLTGGASQLVGTAQMAQHILGRQVRLGRPIGLRGMPDSASGPASSTAAGLLAWAAGDGRALADIDFDAAPPRGFLGRVLGLFRGRA